MPTKFQDYSPNQQFLLPPSMKDWLPEDHLVWFINDTIDLLDLSSFYARYVGDGRRRPPFEPTMMVKVMVFGYATGVFSSRKMARRLHEDVAFRVLAANNFPAHRTLREFRQLHRGDLADLFVQVVELAKEAGLVKLGRVGIDGTKVRANASKHKAMSYARMKKEKQRLKSEIETLLKQADQQDRREDQQFGSRQGDELPAELSRREQRLQTIEAAKQRLEARQQAADEAQGRHKDDDDNTRGPSGRLCKRELGEPEDKAQDNFTDPESRIMVSTEGFQQCYNAQAAVDENQLIIATGVGNNASDQGQLLPILDQVLANTGCAPQVLLADAGYASEETFTALEKRSQEAYVSLARRRQDGQFETAKYPATARMAERLKTPLGKAHYRRRKVLPEPVFGWIKQAIGFRRFSFRGEVKVRDEWNLVCLAANLKRMKNLGWQPA
jgi:transposase